MKTSFLNFVLSILTISFLASCEDVIDIDLKQGNTLLAIDGGITTLNRPDTIKLTLTAPYFENKPAPAVIDAQVSIADNEGNKEILRQVSNGKYIVGMRGKIGNTYTLNIKYKGEEYEAITQVKRVPEIDSLVVRFEKPSNAQTEGYYVYLFVPEPAGVGDYYRFKVYKNDTLWNQPSDLSIAYDRLVDGNRIDNLQINFKPFHKKDKIKVEVLAITEDHFQFYTEMQAQINNGGLNARPPANVRTNILNKNPKGSKAVGYFGGAGISAKTVIVN
ncbi:MAG: DUF4249 domain-containing protein [Cytophagales bacterium]|nr:MAG: DUF4249 domain-containing protein [Cytophagales bacterium]